MRFLLLFVACTAFAERIPWMDSKFHGTPEPPALFRLERAFPKLNFTNPVELTWAPEFNRFMMVELGTKVHLFANDNDTNATTLLLDLKAAKPEATRVYSFTLHPQFAKNRRATTSRLLNSSSLTSVRKAVMHNRCVSAASRRDPFVIFWKCSRTAIWQSSLKVKKTKAFLKC